MIGNTLLHCGTEEQRARFLPRIISGEDRWCQGYSEPGAGSDLPSVECTAVRDGDHWVISGQKIWTSLAHCANWIFLLARSDVSTTRHRGLTFLVCPLDQPGITIKPIANMTTTRQWLNEVVFDGARTSVSNTVGDVNGGWSVAMVLLGFERGEAAATQPMQFREELYRLCTLARVRDRIGDPGIRQKLSWCYSKVEIMKWLGYRTLTRIFAGQPLGPEASISKLYWSEYHQRVTELALDILGTSGQILEGRQPNLGPRTDDPGSPNTSASWIGTFLKARAGTLYAGTSEIQRNTIGELVLGLPK
jgi:alkylation response protein AidB-like acyl-CoA dehydrogenase